MFNVAFLCMFPIGTNFSYIEFMSKLCIISMFITRILLTVVYVLCVGVCVCRLSLYQISYF